MAYLPVLRGEQAVVAGRMKFEHLAIKAGDDRVASNVAIHHTDPIVARALLVVFAAVAAVDLLGSAALAVREVARSASHGADIAGRISPISPGADGSAGRALGAKAAQALVTAACIVEGKSKLYWVVPNSTPCNTNDGVGDGRRAQKGGLSREVHPAGASSTCPALAGRPKMQAATNSFFLVPDSRGACQARTFRGAVTIFGARLCGLQHNDLEWLAREFEWEPGGLVQASQQGTRLRQSRKVFSLGQVF